MMSLYIEDKREDVEKKFSIYLLLYLYEMMDSH